MISPDLYDCTWGGVRLWCSSLATTGGRTQVVHELAEGDDHVVQDRGRDVRQVVAEILFVEMPRETTPPLERLQTFIAQIEGGERHLFTHPIEGAFYVNISDWSYTVDEDSEIASASATFIKSADAESPTPSGEGTAAATGSDAVEARTEEANEEFEAVGIDSTIADDIEAAQASWVESETIPTRQVIVDVAGLSSSLGDFIEDEGLEHDLKLFGAYRAAIMLGSAMRAAALAALASTPRLTAIRIGASVSLLALCVRMYGGREAESRMRQILDLNDIRTPGWLAQGLTITVPVPSRNL